MEEAEYLVVFRLPDDRLLADSIIVMQKGKIVAAGTPLHLKAKYGYGYRLILNSSADPQSTKPPVNSATFESSAAGQIVWRIEDASDLSRAVRWADQGDTTVNETIGEIEEQRVQDIAPVAAWEITMPTLEDVLLERKLF